MPSVPFGWRVGDQGILVDRNAEVGEKLGHVNVSLWRNGEHDVMELR
jgi:hypothetical protein